MIWWWIAAILAVVLTVLVIHAELSGTQTEARYPPLGKFVTVDGLMLHYVEQGQGRPIVLLHGDSGSTYDFTMSPLFEKLAEKYHVFAFDRPGLGYSQRPREEGWSPITQAQVIHAAARQLGIEKPIVIGHSRGGAALFAWALDYPEDLSAAIGLAPAAFPGGISLYRVADIPIVSDLLYYLLVYPAERFKLLPITRRSLDIAFAPDRPAPPDYADAFVSLWLRRRHAKAALSDIAHAGDHTARLVARYPEIRVPFIVVNGQADHNVSPRWALQLEQMLPNARTVLLPDTGHEIMFNRPDEVVEAVELAWKLAANHPG